jgi:predicted MFS family arabinose efflux permease
MTMISPYFPLSKTGRVISAAMRGVIISSYPFGNALTTPFIKNFIQKLGTKTIISVGLICMMAFNLFFGAVPLIFE